MIVVRSIDTTVLNVVYLQTFLLVVVDIIAPFESTERGE